MDTPPLWGFLQEWQTGQAGKQVSGWEIEVPGSEVLANAAGAVGGRWEKGFCEEKRKVKGKSE